MKSFIVIALSVILAQGAIIPSFDNVDKDGNGKITRKEFDTVQQEHIRIQTEAGASAERIKNTRLFFEMDINHNNTVSYEEFRHYKKQQAP